MNIVNIYHCRNEHTKIIIKYINKDASKQLEQVLLLSHLKAPANFIMLHQTNTLI